jgi:hypothetical protein
MDCGWKSQGLSIGRYATALPGGRAGRQPRMIILDNWRAIFENISIKTVDPASAHSPPLLDCARQQVE